MSDFNRSINLKIPASPEYVGVARLIVAAFSDLTGFDSEAVEDIKIAVSEACTNAMLHLYKHAPAEDKFVRIACYVGDSKLVVDVEYPTKEAVSAEKVPLQSYEHDLGASVLVSIMDKVEVVRSKDRGTTIRLVKEMANDHPEID